MRPRQALAAVAASLTVALVPGAVSAAPAAERDCAGRDFPLKATLDGGPSAYLPGGEPREWTLKVRNTSDTVCTAVHPVAVLVDDGRELEPAHIRLRFRDDAARRWRTVRFKETDHAENVGVFAGGFRGLTLRPDRDVTVKLRLAFTGDAPAGAVTATVSAMQRRAGDGTWAGQSPAYAFTVMEPDAYAPRRPEREETGALGDLQRAPDTSAAPRGGTDHGKPASGGSPWSLADSGPGLMAGLGCTAGAFLLGGGALLVGSRRLWQTPNSRSHRR